MSVCSVPRRRWRAPLALTAALGLLLTTFGAAVADTVTASSADFQVVANVNNLSVSVGQTKTVRLAYGATGGDSVSGCNLSGRGSHDLTLNVQQVAVPPTTGNILQLPSSIVFDSCGDVLNLNVKALQPGSTRVQLGFASGPGTTTAADYDLSGATFVVNVPSPDTTPPSIAYTLSPQPNAAGWNNSDVSVDWTVSDAQSAVSSSSGCADTSVSTDTDAAGTSLTCTATSAGGAASETAVVKLDKTPPTVTPVVSGTVGDDGWYVGDVDVTWQSTDGGAAGIDSSSPGCAGSTLTTDTASQTYSCTVTDRAGNSTTASTTVKRDATTPLITNTVNGTAGSNGWFTGDVDVDWTVTDATAGLSGDTVCDDAALTADSAAATYACDAVDNAGNEAHASVTVKRDATAPTVTPHVTGTEGQNGWYTTDVAVSWTLDDNLSGVDQSTAEGCTDGSVTTDTTGAGQTFTCTVTDNAGNRTSESVTVKRDATAPSVSHTITGTVGDNDWYTTEVGISWTWSDATAGVATTLNCDPVTQSTDTDGTTYTCTVTDLAGNSAPDTVTIKVDRTAPTVTPVVTGTEGLDDWYTSDVGLTWTYGDGADRTVEVVAGCDDQVVTADTAGDSFGCSVKDAAGNAASGQVVIKRDATAPTVAGSYSGTPGNHGWYTGTGDVTWTLGDETSGVAAATGEGCGTTAVDAETDGTGYTCSVRDQAGNLGQGQLTVKLDMTAPEVSEHVDGMLGDNDWYRGDVSVTWDVTDALSGMAQGTVTGCGPATLASDSARADFTCSAEDAAGNSTGKTVTVKRDATAPHIDQSVAGPLGDNGWYTGDVTVDWTITEGMSGLAASTDCVDAGLTADAGETTFGCHAVDNAGNEASDSVTLKRDATAPAVEVSVTGDQGDDGWYTGDVSVHWTVTDNLSGVATTTDCGDQSVTSDTAGATFTCAATDEAGNRTTTSVVVKRDATAPSASALLTGTLGKDGWYTSDVTVSWTPSDATSGVDDSRTTCAASSQTTDTTGSEFSCTTTDQAGNRHTDTVTVKRDSTPPVISWTAGPAAGSSYDFGDAIPTPSCSATDATSGVDGGCAVTGGGSAVGQWTLTAAATDRAGNQAHSDRSYTVNAWTIDGFYRPVDMGANVVNSVKAGSTVPLKFNVLKGGTMLSAGIGARFTAMKVSCSGDALSASVDEFTTTGSTSLRWDSTSEQWIQNWATPKTGKGSCYRVDLTTLDGSSTSALFSLK